MLNTQEIRKTYDLKGVKAKKEELENQVNSAVALFQNSDVNKAKLFADLDHFTTLYNLMLNLDSKINQYDQAIELVNTEKEQEIKDLGQLEVDELETQIPTLQAELRQIEIEYRFQDLDDNKSVILEIRAGAGGEEAALFAADLFRMYSRFADNKGLKVEINESSISENGGYKEVIALISGKDVYKKLKYESGVHRVQRVPATEAAGRIHTSTASVAIMPEAKDIDVVINPQDIRIDVMRASGAGGQCVNRTDSAVRITHLESGIVVSCQETKHQSQNKEKAMAMLRARLYAKMKKEADEKRDNLRSSQIGAMMRAEKIRTYNYPQGRVTDHRIHKSWFNIELIMDGNIDKILDDINRTIMDLRLKAEMGIELDLGNDADED
jgi:peptide chain release factor 1